MSRITNRMLVVFFCTMGWVCVGPALGADDTGAANSNIFEGAGNTAAPPANPGATPAAAPVETQPIDFNELDNGAVKVGAFGEIDLHVKDLDVATVLQLLSIQSKRNIVATKDVAGSVTADLYGVDFYEALDAILQPNGFGYREKGKFIYVYTQAQLSEIAKQEEKPVVKVVKLNYINAKDASTFVTPLLSGAGSIALSGEPPVSIMPTTSDAGSNTSAHMDTLVIRDLQGNVEQINSVLNELDVRPRQVSIKATVLQATMSEANGFGVDISILSGVGPESFLTPFNFIEDLASGNLDGAKQPNNRAGVAEITPGNAVNGPSNVQIGFVAGSVQAFIRALDEVTDTTIIANPEVLVLNRQRADLLIGGRLGYVSTQQTETSSTQTVEFLDVGTQLTVRPFVSSDDMVRLELRPSVSTGFTQLQGGFVIPNTETQELTTNVMVHDGKTVVIGGLFQEDHQVSRSQVPGLGDVPILGNAFKGVDDASNRSEVIFMITPNIVKDDVLYAQGERAVDSADYVMRGARQRLLPWSRSKLTASHMTKAIEAYRAGDTEEAMYHADAALHVDGGIVDAQRLKANITGQRIHWYNRSILSDIVNERISGKMQPADAGQPEGNEWTASDEQWWQPTPGKSAKGADAEATPAESTEADKTAATETDWNDAAPEAGTDEPTDIEPVFNPEQPQFNNADEAPGNNKREVVADENNNANNDESAADVIKAVNDLFGTENQNQPQNENSEEYDD